MRKITMFIASLFLTIGAMAQVVADGVYTIQADVNGSRGYMAAANNQTRPVLTEITYSGCEGKGCSATDLVENGKLWYVKNYDGNVYIYNIGKGMFINDGNNNDDICFGEDAYAFKAQTKTSGTDNYIQVYTIVENATGTQNRYLSLGCSRNIPDQVNWDTNGGDSGNFLTLTAVENGLTTYATQIAAADAIIKPEVETPAKKYYLKFSGWAGTTKVTGYLNLSVNLVTNTHGLILSEKQELEIEEVEIGTEKATVISAMLDGGTDGIAKYYIAAPEGQNAGWQAVVTKDVNKALPLTFSENTDGTYYISSAKGGFKLDAISGTDPRIGLYTNGDATSTAAWIIEEAVSGSEEPESPAAGPLTYVSHTPNGVVESINSVTITFDREVGSVDENMLAMNVKLKQGTDAPARGASATIDGNSVTFYLNNNVTVSGNYKFVIADGTVTAADGGVFAGGEYDITIDGDVAIENPTTTVNIDNKLTGDIEILFTDNIEFAEGAEKLQLTAGGVAVAEFIVGENAEIDGDVLVLTLAEDLEPEATTSYKLQIPANFIKKANSTKTFAGKTLTYKVKVPFAVKNITPATGSTVEAFENIVVEFNAEVLQGTSFKLVNTENNEEVALTATTSLKVITLTATDVANGTYKLVGLENVKDFNNASPANASEYTITVAAPAAPELDELEYKSFARNPLLTAWEGEYKLTGVKLNFFETVEGTTVEDRVKLRDGVTEYGKIVDAEGNTVAVLDKKMGANDHNYATLYTSTPVTTAGTYKVIVYSGVIVTMDGEAEYKGGEFEFTVAERGVEIESIYAPDAEVTSMRYCLDYEITINYYNTVEVDAEKFVTMTVGEKTYKAEVTPVEESWGYVIYIAFDAEAEYAYGDYTLTIPEGLYTVNDTPNAIEVYEFTYAEPAPTPGEGGEVEPITVTVTPASSTVVEQIEAIKVLFSNEMMYANIGYLYMYDQNEQMYLLAPAFDYGTGVFVPINMFNDEPIVITEPGIYTLSLANYAEFGLTGDMEFSWTIEEGETTAIDSVDAEAENAVIYDLTGRRVEKITKAGIYVINGVKVLVK